MKKFFLKALCMGVVLGIAGLAGCQNPFEPIRKPAPQGKGSVVITIDGAGANRSARTIAPEGSAFVKYTLTFSGPEAVDPVEVTGATAEVELAVGTWTISATGYAGTEGSYVPVAEGSASTAVSSGDASSLTILLGPKTGGEGTFSYSLKIPEGLDSARLMVSTPAGETVKSIPLTYNALGITGSETLDSGEYLARLRLQKGALFAGLTEALHIYTGLDSALPLQEFTDDDFKVAVGGGFDLTGLITAPAYWADPVAAFAEQEQYTGTVAWEDGNGDALDGKFGENTAYRAVVTLTAKPGYTFTGVAANSFVYTGATVTNVADSGVVTIAFPPTEAAASTPQTNAEHLAMLAQLGVNVNDPQLPIAPNNGNYNPQSKGTAGSLGPLGNTFSFPKREFFWAGNEYIVPRHELFEDAAIMGSLGYDSSDDSRWANGRFPLKSVAADLDGDGLDEVVIVTLRTDEHKILITKGEYKNSAFTITPIRELDEPENLANVMGPPSDNYTFSYTGWKLIAADLNGDGKQEIVLTLPGKTAAYLYILNHDLTVRSSENVKPLYAPDAVGMRGCFPMAAAADYDQDGKDELCVMFGMDVVSDSFSAPYVILDDMDTGFTELRQGTIAAAASKIAIGDIAAGDFTGDGLPDTVFYGRGPSTDHYLSYSVSGPPYGGYSKDTVLMLLETSMGDKNFSPNFALVSDKSITEIGNRFIISYLVAGDVDGDRKMDLFAGNYFWTVNGAKQFEQMSAGTVFEHFPFYKTGFAMGDITGDRRDDVVFFEDGIFSSGGEAIGYLNVGVIPSSDYQTFCLPNVDDDTFILRDTGDRELLFADPQVLAVLASPPYYAETGDEDLDGGTSFGHSAGSSSGTTNSSGYSVGVSFGYEFEFLGTGIELEASLKENFSWSQSESLEVSESWGWNTPVGQDLVIFTAVAFDVYYYEVASSPPGEGAQPGDILTVNVPRKPHIYHTPLQTYNAGVPAEHRITLPHTLGAPFSYFTPEQRNEEKVKAENRGLFSTNTYMTAGAGGGSTVINMERLFEEGSTYEYELEFEAEAKVKIGGASVGMSVGFSEGYESATTVTQGTYIEGTVPAIPSSYYTAALDFDWGLMAYPRIDHPKQRYIFVTYWTKRHQ